MDDTLNNSLVGNVKGSLALVQNFYIEFFGTFIPGTVGVSSMFLLALGFCYCLHPDIVFIRNVVEIAFSSVGGVLAFLTSSYVVGAIAYRRTPKVLDTISSYLQWVLTRNGATSDEVGRMSVSFDSSQSIPKDFFARLSFHRNRSQWILRKAGSSIDYPYPLLRKYLCCRGLNHLAAYVPWCAGSGGLPFKEAFGKGICSKMHINVIKQRLRSVGHENLIMDMVRNECHIRMLCSLWHILTFIYLTLIPSVILMLILALACRLNLLSIGSQSQAEVQKPTQIAKIARECTCSILLHWMNAMSVGDILSVVVGRERFANSFPSPMNTGTTNKKYAGDEGDIKLWFFLSSMIVGGVLIFFCRHSIERVFHYMRTREVTMILESAWIMDNVDFGNRIGVKQLGGTPLFSDVKAQAEGFMQTHCKKCKYYGRCYAEISAKQK